MLRRRIWPFMTVGIPKLAVGNLKNQVLQVLELAVVVQKFEIRDGSPEGDGSRTVLLKN